MLKQSKFSNICLNIGKDTVRGKRRQVVILKRGRPVVGEKKDRSERI